MAPEREARLRGELGIPEGLLFEGTVSVQSPFVRDDGVISPLPVTTEFVGILTNSPHSEAPTFSADFTGTGEDTTFLELYRFRVYAEGSQSYGEMTWRPDEGIATRAVALRAATGEELKTAERLMRLFVKLPKGRRQGSTKIPHDASWLRERFAAYSFERESSFWSKESNKRITQKDFAEYLRVDTDTLQAALHGAGITFEELEE